jgi:hypothetical protein
MKQDLFEKSFLLPIANTMISLDTGGTWHPLPLHENKSFIMSYKILIGKGLFKFGKAPEDYPDV